MKPFSTLGNIQRLAAVILAGCSLLLMTARLLGGSLPTHVIAYALANGLHKIFLMDTNLALTHSISDLPLASCCLAWSPDSKTLAFSALEKDSATALAHLYLMDADGRHTRRLMVQNEEHTEGYPAWSPDGKTLSLVAFAHRIFLADVQTGEAHWLKEAKTYYFSGFQVWSPDGKTILFTADSNTDYNLEIFVVNVDGSRFQRLMGGPGSHEDPEFSPDGKRIVFTSTRNGNLDIYVMNADGSHLTRLTDTVGMQESLPHWSPDGKYITFTAWQNASSAIYVMGADGSHVRQLTHARYGSWDGLWSPDGGQILFSSNRDGNIELYMINADGSQEHRLTFNPARTIGIHVAWQPEQP